MALLTWSQNYSVGVDAIDRQHQRLVDTINKLHGAMLDGRSQDSMGSILDTLIDYTSKHFAYEETLFSRYDYPERTKHTAVHAELAGKVVAFRQQMKAGKIGISIDLMTFLKGWLSGHIQGDDAKYGPFLQSKGLN